MENTIHKTPKDMAGINGEDLKLKDKDDVLARKIETRMGEGQSLYDAINKEARDNEKVFFGQLEDLAGTKLSSYKSKALLNRIFLTIRNLVGLDTDNLPKIQMIPSKDTKPSIKKAEKIKNNIEWGFIRVEFMDFITKCLFDTRIKRDSFGRWFWNYKKNDFDIEPVMIDEITISPEATTIQDAEWLIYHPLKNRRWWKENYPKEYDKIQFENVKQQDYQGKDITVSEQQTRGSVARLYAYWENDMVVEEVYDKHGEAIILKKSKNPYFEYRDPLLQVQDWAKEARPEAFQIAKSTGLPIEEALPEVLSPEDVEEFKPIVNFLSEARKPFVQFPSMKMLGKFYSANLMKQGTETLINYNEKKRQIADNLRGCNVKVVVDDEQFNEEERAAINDEPMQVIGVNMQNNQRPVQIVAPTFPELGGILTDMRHDEEYLDDLFGSHDVSRGSANAGTLGQDEMNQESDRTPVRMQSRATESAIKEIAEGWIQLMKMFYTEKHWVKKLGGKEGAEMDEIINEDIEEGIEPLIIPQSMMKIDKAGRAIQLWNAKALDPLTLFTDIGMADPKEKADRLMNFLNFGVISDNDPEQTQADLAGGRDGESMTDNSIERANSENEAFQNAKGGDVPPTPKELVSKDHVALHFNFYKDPSKKMEQNDMDLLLAHAEVDKATLVDVMREVATAGARSEINRGRQAKKDEANQVNKGNGKE